MIDNQSQLWNFTFVAHLHKSVDLVRSNVNGQMMVRRISPAADLPVLTALCRIRQRNLMEVYDVRPENGVCVSLCEFINGTTLPERLYDVKTAKQILCQVCDGLTALHSRGIVHRDIKPENIMLLSDGTVKIIDYSISRLMKPDQRKDTTTFGTAGYAPPEQFGFAQTSGTADIYSCGVLLNYMLTGRLLNKEDNLKVGFVIQYKRGDDWVDFQFAEFDSTELDNKNRIEYYYGFNNADGNRKAQLKAVPYIGSRENRHETGAVEFNFNSTYFSGGAVR